jgi:hypothetical protein
MAPNGTQHQRLAPIQKAFQGLRQGSTAPQHRRHRRFPWIDALRAYNKHAPRHHSSRPCRQRTGPSKSPGPSVHAVGIDRRVSYQHVRHHARDVYRTPPWLLLDPRSHHKQKSHQCHVQPPGRGPSGHSNRHERDGWKHPQFCPTLPATSAVNQRYDRTQGTC